MSLQTLNTILRFLPSLSWLALVAVGLWSFWTLLDFGQFRPDGTPRTTLDKSAPYFFLFLVPLGAYMARKVYVEAIPRAENEAEKQNQRRQRQAKAKAELANRPPLSEEVKTKALTTLDHLKAASVIAETEVDTTRFLELCEANYLESGDLYSVSTLLELYADIHGEFDNAFFTPDQVEFSDGDIKAMIENFARLSGRASDLSDIEIKASNPANGGADDTAHFMLAGAAQTIPFAYHKKNAPGDLMEALATLFDPARAFASAYFDSVFLITRLSETERIALNAALDPDHEMFAPLTNHSE